MAQPYLTTSENVPKRDYTLAAWFMYDMNLLAKFLAAQPTNECFSEESPFPARYRSIYLCLGEGKYASLTQTEMQQERIEIDLELHNGQLLDEADLIQVLSILPADIGEVCKMDNGFTWVPIRRFSTNGTSRQRDTSIKRPCRRWASSSLRVRASPAQLTRDRDRMTADPTRKLPSAPLRKHESQCQMDIIAPLPLG